MASELLRSTFTKLGWFKRRGLHVLIPKGGGGFTILKDLHSGMEQHLVPTLLFRIKRYFIHLIFDPGWTSYWYFLVSDVGRMEWNDQLISVLWKNTSKKYQFLQNFTAFDRVWQGLTFSPLSFFVKNLYSDPFFSVLFYQLPVFLLIILEGTPINW